MALFEMFGRLVRGLVCFRHRFLPFGDRTLS